MANNAINYPINYLTRPLLVVSRPFLQVFYLNLPNTLKVTDIPLANHFILSGKICPKVIIFRHWVFWFLSQHNESPTRCFLVLSESITKPKKQGRVSECPRVPGTRNTMMPESNNTQDFPWTYKARTRFCQQQQQHHDAIRLRMQGSLLKCVPRCYCARIARN